MSAFATVIFHLFIFENKNLLSALMPDDGRRDAGAFDRGAADFDVGVGLDEEGFTELDRCADVAMDAVYDEDVAFFDPELFARKVDDGVLGFCWFCFDVHKAKTIRGERGNCKGKRLMKGERGKMKDER